VSPLRRLLKSTTLRLERPPATFPQVAMPVL
jgi:hypothetical protein